jgi:hypothetical protein
MIVRATGRTTYTGTATGPGGTSTCSVTVDPLYVNEPPMPLFPVEELAF